MPMKGENIFREMLIGSTAANVARAVKKPFSLSGTNGIEEEGH